MNKAKEHWCCDCYHYRGDTSVGEICDRTGESTYDSRPDNSHSCKFWEECICGPLNWEDVQRLYIITEQYKSEIDKNLDNFPSSSKEMFEEIIRRFNEVGK